jgi:hypothetical protein
MLPPASATESCVASSGGSNFFKKMFDTRQTSFLGVVIVIQLSIPRDNEIIGPTRGM